MFWASQESKLAKRTSGGVPLKSHSILCAPKLMSPSPTHEQGSYFSNDDDDVDVDVEVDDDNDDDDDDDDDSDDDDSDSDDDDDDDDN